MRCLRIYINLLGFWGLAVVAGTLATGLDWAVAGDGYCAFSHEGIGASPRCEAVPLGCLQAFLP